MDALVTVIMPLYNTGECLKYSFQSVHEQSYRNLEILLIDDGSSDHTLAISKELAKTDERVRVIHKENGGVSSARNVGIDNAHGEYIAFIDGDDIVAKNYVEQLLNACKGRALSVCMHARITSYSTPFQKPAGEFTVLDAGECAKRVIKGAFPISACASLYSGEKIGTIRFPEGIRHNEDKLFLFQYLLNNENDFVAITNDKLYGYFAREGSATRSAWNGSRDVIRVADKMFTLAVSAHPEWKEPAQANRIRARLDVLKAIVRAGDNTPQNKAAYEDIKRETLSLQLPGHVSRELRVEFTALSAGDFFFKSLVKLYYALVKDKHRFKRNEKLIRQDQLQSR